MNLQAERSRTPWSLFYDIPQTRLSRLSRAFLKLGLAITFVLVLARAIHR